MNNKMLATGYHYWSDSVKVLFISALTFGETYIVANLFLTLMISSEKTNPKNGKRNKHYK